MAIEITRVDAAALDGIIRDKRPDGLFMALVGPRSMFWEAAEVRAGRVAKIYGDFPAVIGWLFLRARVLPGRCRPKNRIVGQDNPWRIVALSKRKDENEAEQNHCLMQETEKGHHLQPEARGR